MRIRATKKLIMAGKNLRGKRPVKLSFGVSWLYVILFIGIGWMFFNQGWANPQKEEWADVTKQWLDGDIKEVTFVRNEYEGMVTIKPDRLEKYVSAFGGNVPKSLRISCSLSPGISMQRRCSAN